LEDLPAFKEKFYRSAKPRPKLHLAGDRALYNFACNASIENEGVGQFDGLTHRDRVA